MKSFCEFLLEAKNYSSIDELSLLNKIEKDSGLLEYFKALLGDRKIFVSELKILAKENKLDIHDYNSIYLKFNKEHSIFDELED